MRIQKASRRKNKQETLGNLGERYVMKVEGGRREKKRKERREMAQEERQRGVGENRLI